MSLWNKIPVHYRTQLARLARIFIGAFVTALVATSGQGVANWKKILGAAALAGLEATWRQIRPATPDAITGPPVD